MKAEEHGDADGGKPARKRERSRRSASNPRSADRGGRDGGRRAAARLSASATGTPREDDHYALPADVEVELPAGYRPSADEAYMNPKQLAYFRRKLRAWREQLVEDSRQSVEDVRDEKRDVGDDAERAARETQDALELRARDRDRNLARKIETALLRIEQGRYGYCEETGEPIGLERLEARVIATLSLDAQERREHLQKQEAAQTYEGAPGR